MKAVPASLLDSFVGLAMLVLWLKVGCAIFSPLLPVGCFVLFIFLSLWRFHFVAEEWRSVHGSKKELQFCLLVKDL